MDGDINQEMKLDISSRTGQDGKITIKVGIPVSPYLINDVVVNGESIWPKNNLAVQSIKFDIEPNGNPTITMLCFPRVGASRL